MKHLYLALTVLVACALGACDKFNSEVNPLMGNETLSTFTALAEDGKTVLTGVANPQSGAVIVQPGEYMSVVGDSDVIICKPADGKLHVYRLNGEKLGVFDLFTHWTENGNYYVGSKYNLQLFYFPKYNETLEVRDTFNQSDIMLMFVDGKWQVRDNFGKYLWQIPSAFTLIKDINSMDKYVFAIAGKYAGALYDYKGNKLKNLSYTRWKKLQADLQNKHEYQGGAAEAEIADLHKLLD